MQVKIIGFGVLQEVLGGEYTVDVERPQPTVTDVLDRLSERCPAFARHRPYTACALGDRMVAQHDRVDGGETLVLLPPVSGG
jgi:molybdopterin converting factor small subunit